MSKINGGRTEWGKCGVSWSLKEGGPWDLRVEWVSGRKEARTGPQNPEWGPGRRDRALSSLIGTEVGMGG